MTEKENIAFNAGWLFRHVREGKQCDALAFKKDQMQFEYESFKEEHREKLKKRFAEIQLN
jgi:hypothetical protein